MILIGKLLTCKKFRKIGILSKLLHVLDSVHIPDIYQDWDAEDGDVEDHKKRFHAVMKEMTVMVAIQWVSNMSLLVPFVYTGKYEKITNLHPNM